MSLTDKRHRIYENIQDPTIRDGLLANEHAKEPPKSSKTVETNGNGHLVRSSLELNSQTEAVSGHPPFPTIMSPEGDTEPARKVRFYNRVRITSGVGHTGRPKSHLLNKEASQDSIQDGNHGFTIDVPPRRELSQPSTDSSASASYSSSISAPLRSSTELPPRPASARFGGKRRKPLSNVLGSQDASSWLRALAVERRERKSKRMARALDETSPLIQVDGTARFNTASPDVEQQIEENSHRLDGDMTNDDWPWKLFTLYYWEAQLTSLCCCDTDSED